MLAIAKFGGHGTARDGSELKCGQLILSDINAANCLILCGQVGSGNAHIVSDVFSGVGGRKFNGRVDSW